MLLEKLHHLVEGWFASQSVKHVLSVRAQHRLAFSHLFQNLHICKQTWYIQDRLDCTINEWLGKSSTCAVTIMIELCHLIQWININLLEHRKKSSSNIWICDFATIQINEYIVNVSWFSESTAYLWWTWFDDITWFSESTTYTVASVVWVCNLIQWINHVGHTL